jgi:hypothetical protein
MRHGAVDGGQQVGLDEQHFGAAVAEDVAGLVALEVPVDLAVIGAGQAAALDDVDEGRVVPQHHGDHVAVFDAQRGEAAGQARGARVDLGAGTLQRAEGQRGGHAARESSAKRCRWKSVSPKLIRWRSGA